MRKNIANQKIAAQLVSKTDGSDVTSGTTTVYVTVDAGTQTSIGTATHEGNGCWTIDTGVAGNTNGSHLAFTWVNASAVTVSQNVYPVGYDPGAANLSADVQTIKTQAITCSSGVTVLASLGTASTSTAQTGDAYARLGAPAGASVSADVASVKTDTNQTAGRIVGTLATGTHNPQTGDAYDRIGAAGAGLTALGDTRIANLDATVSSRSTYAGGAVASVTGDVGGNVVGSVASVSGAVTVGTNNDKTGYSLTVTPPTAAQIVTAMEAEGSMLDDVRAQLANVHDTDLPAIAAQITDIDTEVDTIAALVGAMTSASGRVDFVAPDEVIKAASGDKYVECFVQLYDSSRLPFDSRDMDGGNYSANATYNLNERVKPTTNNAGAYYFQITTIVGTGGATAPDWSTAQTPSQTCLDGDGNTWTNIGATDPSTTALHNGFGVTCADEAGSGWELYADNVGTPLARVSECHHWDQSNKPQIMVRQATGLYSFWMNVDDAEADRTIYLTMGWFDKARFEAGYSSTTDHRRVVFQVRIVSAATLTLSAIEGSTVLAKEATVNAAIDDIADLPTAAEIRAEIDTNSTKLDVAVSTRSTFAGGAVASVTNPVTVSGGLTADDVLDEVVDGTYTMRQLLRIMAAVLAGKSSGGGTATITFRSIDDDTNTVVATVDSNGNRSSVTITST